MSKAVRFDFNWPQVPLPEEEIIVEPTKDEVRGKRDHKHGHDRDKNKKDKKFENGWN
jgi:hypothetical protein